MVTLWTNSSEFRVTPTWISSKIRHQQNPTAKSPWIQRGNKALGRKEYLKVQTRVRNSHQKDVNLKSVLGIDLYSSHEKGMKMGLMGRCSHPLPSVMMPVLWVLIHRGWIESYSYSEACSQAILRGQRSE